MEYQGIKKYKPRRFAILSFGVSYEHLIVITLHPNSRWYAYMDKGIWIIECAKTKIRLSNKEFNDFFELVM